MFDDDIGYVNFDPGEIEQNAWDDGYEDGMNEIIRIINKYKLDSREIWSEMFLEKLLGYIDENRPRR